MKNKELIELLKTLPEDAEVFYGYEESYKQGTDLPIFTLYNFEVLYYKELRSCRSCLPSSNSIKTNVIVLEYD